MARTAGDRAVVQMIPAARVTVIAVTLGTLLTFAVAIVFAHNRVTVILGSLAIGIIYGGMMILLSPKLASVAPPLRIEADELPPIAFLWKAIIPSVALVAIFDAGVAICALSLQGDFDLLVGMMLAMPLMSWDSFRRAKRTERELRGTLWITPNFAWTSKSRSRYLVPRE